LHFLALPFCPCCNLSLHPTAAENSFNKGFIWGNAPFLSLKSWRRLLQLGSRWASKRVPRIVIY
jgi:hypothetical protein